MPTVDVYGNLLSLEGTTAGQKYTLPGAAGYIAPPAPAKPGVDRYGPAWLDPAKMKPGDWNMVNGEWVSSGVNPLYGPAGTIAGSTPQTSFDGYQGTAGGVPVAQAPAAPVAQPVPTAAPAAAPFSPKLPYAGFDINLGSNDPAMNHQVYGDNYFPGADPRFQQLLAKYMGQAPAAPIDQAGFAVLAPAQQGLYRQALAEWFQTGPGKGDPFQDGNMGSGVIQGPPGTMPGNQTGAVNSPTAQAATPLATASPTPTGNTVQDWTVNAGPFAGANNGALGDTRPYASQAVGEGDGPPLRMHTPYEEIVLSPEYQFQKDRLTQQLEDLYAGRGRSNSSAALQGIGDQLRGLLAGEISRQDETNFNRSLTLNDLLFNRNRTQNNTDFNRADRLAQLAAGASNPQNLSQFGNSIVSTLIQQAILEAQLGIGAGSNTGNLLQQLSGLGIDIIGLLNDQQLANKTGKTGGSGTSGDDDKPGH